MVAPLFHAQGEIAALHHHDMLDAGGLAKRVVGVMLEGEQASPSKTAVCRDEDLGLRIEDAITQRLRGEPSEYDTVDGTDARAGEHRDDGLRNQGHVNRNAVALRHAETSQDVSELVDLAPQVEIGPGSPVAGLALPNQRRLVPPRPPHVPVEAVGRGVDLPTDEPAGIRSAPLKHRVPGLLPLEFPRKRLPERQRILPGSPVDVGVDHPRSIAKGLTGIELARLLEKALELSSCRGRGLMGFRVGHGCSLLITTVESSLV